MTLSLRFSRYITCTSVIIFGLMCLTVEVTLGEEIERTKREFMELVVQDIDRKNSHRESEMEKQKEEAKGEALFVQLPTLIPFIDFDFWYIDRDLRWDPPKGSSLPSVRVPKGFVSDLASVPPFLWGKYPPIGRYAYAAVVHDYLYWTQTTTQDVADEILAIGMRDAGTDEAAISRFKFAVRSVGGIAWANNRKAKAKGEKRILAVLPTDKLMSWAIYSKNPGVFKK